MDSGRIFCNKDDCEMCKSVLVAKDIYDIKLDKIKLIAIGDIKSVYRCLDKNTFIRLSRYTMSIFKNLSVYINLYNDIISEMISNHTTYPDIIFYILDVKFIAWKRWLEIILFWNRYLGIHCKLCSEYRNVIKGLSDLCNNTTRNIIKSLEIFCDLDRKIRDIFIKTDEKIYEMFIDELFKKIIIPPEKNGECHTNMRLITDTICSWMSVSVFELLSIEMLLTKHKMLVSGSIISKMLDGYNIIDVFKDVGLTINDYVFTSPDLYKYKYMFFKDKILNS